MRVRYKGKFFDRSGRMHRLACVDWIPEEDEKADAMICAMFAIGWDYDRYDCAADFYVLDREDFESFMGDWKDAKKELRKKGAF